MRGLSLALALAALAPGCQGTLEVPLRPGANTPSSSTGSGIRLTPPAGVGERALACEADHAPLRRLNHAEYQRTIRDLFRDYTVPPVQIAPDARRGGFTNNFEALNPSTLLVTQHQENATMLAGTLAQPITDAQTCGLDEACFRQLVTDLGARAYRRPLTTEEVDEYTSFFAAGPGQGDFAFALEMALTTFLQSPHFIYRPELGAGDGKLSQHEIASRLSYFLWGTMPDDALFAAAAAGDLRGPGLEAEIDRMLADGRAREGLLTATSEWLELDRLETRLKGEGYLWSPEIRDELRESVERFMWERVISEGGSLEALMTARGAYVSSRIGPIFGVTDAGDELEWRELDDRHGLLTQPAILATHAHGTYGSPVLRGVFILTEVLCDPPQPPPPGASMGEPPTEDDTGSVITNRRGYELLTQSASGCASCHDQINPFGFALEGYDTVGAVRTTDQGQPIDTTGSTVGFTLGERFAFDGAEDLATQLGQSSRVRACVVDRWVRYATGGGALAYDPCVREEIEEIASRPDATLRDIVVAIALHPKFADAEIVE